MKPLASFLLEANPSHPHIMLHFDFSSVSNIMGSACFTSPSHLLTRSQRQISRPVHLFGGCSPFSISHINNITPGVTREQPSVLFLSRHLPAVPHLIIPEPGRRSAPLAGGGIQIGPPHHRGTLRIISRPPVLRRTNHHIPRPYTVRKNLSPEARAHAHARGASRHKGVYDKQAVKQTKKPRIKLAHVKKNLPDDPISGIH